MSDTENARRLPRRDFLRASAAAIAASSTIGHSAPRPPSPAPVPWFRRTLRWAQTNITEIDPAAYDIPWWRQHWKRTRVQGVIINAGGIVAYYPSKYPLHYRARALGDRDLYGELAKAAHDDGLAVLARMDSNRAHDDFHRAHPDWFAIDASGRPYRAGELYVACVNSPYYDEYLPGILREIIERSHPEGITDNSWSGLGRDSVCYCANCTRRFKERTGRSLPRQKNWDDLAYREWIGWSYARRLEIWDLNNRTTKTAGGPDCLWIGMNSGSISGQCRSLRDYKEICRRAEIIMLDHQARGDSGGFQQNAETGNLIHGLLGWDKLIPESTALYQAGRAAFRRASKPEPEVRLWALEGFAGGIQPWWHHVGAYQEDRRQFKTIEAIHRWHEANQQFLVNRRPMATVGLVWSQQHTDFYGRDNPEEMVELPLRGMANALLRARIPYVPVHVDHIDRDGPPLSVLILSNLAAMSEGQCASVRRFVERGGHLIATGRTSLYDEWGQPRPDFALADLLGVHFAGRRVSIDSDRKRASESQHTYLRLAPELRAGVYGPKAGDEPGTDRRLVAAGQRHPVLQGFDETDILPFGGSLDAVQAEARTEVPMTFIPAFPAYPPETAWMRQPRTNIPGLIVRVWDGLTIRPTTTDQGSRIAYLPADLDRRFARDNLPDHGNLLANLVRWAAGETIPLAVEGRGLVDCHLYRQAGRLILHVVNLTNAGTWRAPVDELIPIGPLRIKVRLPADLKPSRLRLLVAERELPLSMKDDWTILELPTVLDHEVVVVE